VVLFRPAGLVRVVLPGLRPAPRTVLVRGRGVEWHRVVGLVRMAGLCLVAVALFPGVLLLEAVPPLVVSSRGVVPLPAVAPLAVVSFLGVPSPAVVLLVGAL